MNDISPVAAGAAGRQSASFLQRTLRSKVLESLAGIQRGFLIFEDAGGSLSFGDRDAALRARVSVRDPSFYRALALGGSVGAAEAYMDGAWETDDLVTLIQVLLQNRDILDNFETGFARLGAAALRFGHRFRKNTLTGSRKNIAAHYDLGNDFFTLFLSPDLMYSSALWDSNTQTLAQASQNKLARICSLLELTPQDHVVEIGTGWGGFAEFAARNHGCRVTTTTISKEQHRHAVDRIARAGLSERVNVVLQDYRELTGQAPTSMGDFVKQHATAFTRA